MFLYGLYLSSWAHSLLNAQGSLPADPPQEPAGQMLTVPAGSRLAVAVIAPLWVRTARAGDALEAMTDLPVSAANQLAIPAGVQVQGTITRLTLPSRRDRHAELELLFTRLVFANGYSVRITDRHPDQDHPATAMRITIQLTPANDLLLDSGAAFEITLASPLVLDERIVADAAASARPPVVGRYRSATLCRSLPPHAAGSPGVPAGVAPDTPGSPSIPGAAVPAGPATGPAYPASPAGPSGPVGPVMPGMAGTPVPGAASSPPTDSPTPPPPETAGSPAGACPASPVVVSSTPVPYSAPVN